MNENWLRCCWSRATVVRRHDPQHPVLLLDVDLIKCFNKGRWTFLFIIIIIILIWVNDSCLVYLWQRQRQWHTTIEGSTRTFLLSPLRFSRERDLNIEDTCWRYFHFAPHFCGKKMKKRIALPKKASLYYPLQFLDAICNVTLTHPPKFPDLHKISSFHPFRNLHQQKLIRNVWLRPYKQRRYVGTRHHRTKISATCRCAVCIFFFLHGLERLDEICNLAGSVGQYEPFHYYPKSGMPFGMAVSHSRVGHTQVKSSLVTSKLRGARESFYLSESPTRLRKDEERCESNRVNSMDEHRNHPAWERHWEMLCRPHASLCPVSLPGVSWYLHGVPSCCHTRSSWTWRESDRLPSPLSRLVCLRMGAAWRFEEEKTVEDGSLVQTDTCLLLGRIVVGDGTRKLFIQCTFIDLPVRHGIS